MNMVYHKSPCYLALNGNHANGAYFYAKEIYINIIPHINSNRPWVLLNVEGNCFDNAIVFIHNNKNPERYLWLKDYQNLILVCSQPHTMEKIKELFPQFIVIYLPLSIDTSYVKLFRKEIKTKEIAYYGRKGKCPPEILSSPNIDKIWGVNRNINLTKLADYKKVIAIGRCALEAKALGCETFSHAGVYEKTDFKLLDNKDVIPILQTYLDLIDNML